MPPADDDKEKPFEDELRKVVEDLKQKDAEEDHCEMPVNASLASEVEQGPARGNHSAGRRELEDVTRPSSPPPPLAAAQTRAKASSRSAAARDQPQDKQENDGADRRLDD
jgi:hypothetical protein